MMWRPCGWTIIALALLLCGCAGGKGSAVVATAVTTPTVALPPRQSTTTGCPATPLSFDSRSSATAYVQSFYNAINRQEYGRAFSYLFPLNPLPTPVPPAPTATPSPTLAQWQAGYAHTACVIITYSGPEASVTSQTAGYAGLGVGTLVPISFAAIGDDGSLQQFAGTYVVRYDPAQGISAAGYLDLDFAHITQTG